MYLATYIPVIAPGTAALMRPTSAEPGSAEKIAVLAQRAARGEPLFHPRDLDWTTASVPSGPGRAARLAGMRVRVL